MLIVVQAVVTRLLSPPATRAVERGLIQSAEAEHRAGKANRHRLNRGGDRLPTALCTAS